MALSKEEAYEALKALTAILKKKLRLMMIQKWNGKDFTNLDELSGMADDILKVLSIAGLKYYSELKKKYEGDK